MNTARDTQIGVDSQCLSYLIDALCGITPPIDTLAPQRLALVRIYFYAPGTIWTTFTVAAECVRIRQVERAELHRSWISVLFGTLPIRNQQPVGPRSSSLLAHHRGSNDCSILAEAEAVGHDVLLTFDKAFRQNLSTRTKVTISEPVEYWNLMAIKPGAPPLKTPASDNPLLHQSWWRA